MGRGHLCWSCGVVVWSVMRHIWFFVPLLIIYICYFFTCSFSQKGVEAELKISRFSGDGVIDSFSDTWFCDIHLVVCSYSCEIWGYYSSHLVIITLMEGACIWSHPFRYGNRSGLDRMTRNLYPSCCKILRSIPIPYLSRIGSGRVWKKSHLDRVGSDISDFKKFNLLKI